MKKSKEDKKFKIQVAVFAILVCITIISITYGVFFTNKNQGETNKIASGCFSSTFTDGNNSITLANALPTTDADGLASTPYTFNLKNTCTIKIKYAVILNVKSGSFSDSYVGTSLDGTSSKALNTYQTNTTYTNYIESDYSNSYILSTGVLDENSSLDFSFRAWLLENVTYENVKGSSWDGQIKVVSLATS